MYSEKELCDKIRSIYPEIGECGIDVEVEYDGTKEAWVVDLRKDGHRLITHLEPADASTCMEDRQCVSLGAQIGQLVQNIYKV
jgi:hypothetical protein